MMHHVELVLFDLDGVLIDTAPILKRTYCDISDELGLACPPETEIRRTVTMSPQRAIDYLFGEHALRAGELFSEVWGTNVCCAMPFEGIPELLRDLRNLRIAVGTVTSRNSAEASILLKVSHLDQYIDDLVTWGHYRVAKPSPACILVAVERMKRAPDSAAYVGDLPNDIKAARAAGCLAIGAVWSSSADREALKSSGADLIVEKPHEIKRIILKG